MKPFVARTRKTNQQGLMNSFIVAIILVVLAFIIILIWAVRIGYLSNEDANVNLCRVTLAAQELSQVGASNFKTDSPLSSACPRRIVNIVDSTDNTKDGIYLYEKGKNAAKLPVYRAVDKKPTLQTKYSIDQETLANYFAESMRRCWLKGLEGQVQVFNDRGNNAASYVDITKTVCMICDETHIDIQQTTTKPTGIWLSQYLKTTVMQGRSDGMTYDQYLFNLVDLGSNSAKTSTAQKECIVDKRINEDPSIRDGSYATIFFRDFGKKAVGCMAVYVVPAQQVRSICDYVAN